ncbi:surface polysaccharide O-acyltransferase-like enzyme [Lacinutrix venerupis]|uniref:acyltransferase n=1 Tax=Lacinutrix venerupis TaxID=1486034 RepID=UPI000EB3970D|nr:acyltransferase family protein [Lacinutrix venerupis]RLJ61483.1 surface polysaccharide O-acyltransferase-like enzyme [Lacinutrix venerupis]
MIAKRNNLIDISKFILAIMVVGAHTDFFIDINKLIWYLLKNGLFRITVPIFLMINGYYFFNINTKQHYIKWLKRVLILYLIWMAIYFKYWHKQDTITFFELFTFGWHHLWYLAALLCSGLVLYFLKKASNKRLTAIILTLFLTGVFIQYIKVYINVDIEFLNNIIKKPYVVRNFIFFGLPFMATGLLIRRNQEKLTKKTTVITIIGFILLFIESYINYKLTTNKGFDILFTQIIVCPSLFILILQTKINTKFNTKTISLYSSAIYFSHTIPWIYIVMHYQFTNTTISIITVLATIALSYILIQLNKKIKYLL